jgi:CheY-like chemotaxis protein
VANILVAEDSLTQAMQIQLHLEEQAHVVTLANDGAQALSLMSDALPDLVLTDMQMPEVNGLELINAIRLRHPSVPVVLLTAEGSDELAMEALRSGASSYVPKSRMSDSLIPVVDEVLELLRVDRSYARLVKSLDYNEFRFTLENDLELIDPLVELIQQMVFGMGMCDPTGRVRLGMALEHALLNALYRGNLEIPRQQADQEQSPQNQGSLVAQRLAEPLYRDRRIHFEAKLDSTQSRFVVSDDGPGFDTSALPDPKDPHILEREGGRGLVLIRSFMDELEFNDKGNSVTMVKRHEPPSM